MSAMVAHPQYGPSCAQIKHGTRPESFVQRITCARQAVLGGNTPAAYELMAPIYRNARNTTSNTRPDSQAKLSIIVELQLPDTGRQLIKQYGIDDVYTALAQVAGIDPATGGAAASKRTLPAPLTTSVANALQPARVSKPAVRPAQPAPQQVVEHMKQRELTAQEKELVMKAQRQPVRIFALNNVLDNLFFIALESNDSDVCQNLIFAIKQTDDSNVKAIVDIIALYHQQGDNAQSTYSLLKEKLASYKIVQWLGFGNKNKTTQELFDLWIETVPSMQLVQALEKSGMPTDEQERQAGAYLERYNQGTNALRLSNAITLLRNAKSLLFQPGEKGQTFRTPSPLTAVVTVLAIYQALREGLLANKFRITPETQFLVQGKNRTLAEIDTQFAGIVKEEFIRVKMENIELQRQGYIP
jgi:hypothetical protein